MRKLRHTPYGVDGTSLTVDDDFMKAEALHAESLTALYVEELPEGGPVDFVLEGRRAEHDD